MGDSAKGPSDELIQHHLDNFTPVPNNKSTYDHMVDEGYIEIILGPLDIDNYHGVTLRQLGEVFDKSYSTVQQAIKRYKRLEAENKVRQRPDAYLDPPDFLLGGNFVEIKGRTDGELAELVDFFGRWRNKHFTTRHGEPYTLPKHQRRWALAIFRAIRDSSLLLILSPPRHGKTMLLTHFDIFIITKVNPNLSLVRVGKNQSTAEEALASVKDELEHNESLREECLESGENFKPPYKSSRSWSAAEFTVDTRNITGIKSPTMRAVGSGGTLLSKDGDVYTVDDIDDHQTTKTAHRREQTRRWWANDLMSRKEPGICIVAIGSRQHPDDMWGHLLDSPYWDTIVEQAHDETCDVPDSPSRYDDHIDCMLWPSKRPYSWLMEKKNDPNTANTFEMTYQNNPTDDDSAVFSRELIDSVLDKNRIDGKYRREAGNDWPVPKVYDSPRRSDGPFQFDSSPRLVAGLDPSAKGYQASGLIAYDPSENMQLWVDYENRLGGGAFQARSIIERWHKQYGLTFWVIEENLYHGGIINDEHIKTYAAKNGITIRPHGTYVNKWDQDYGVTSMANLMTEGLITIPYGDSKTKQRWKIVRKQLIQFSHDDSRSNRKTDIVMAFWFPQEILRKWRKDYLASQQQDQEYDYPFFEISDPFMEEEPLRPEVGTRSLI